MDSFTDNPLIGAVGNALGLGALFAEGGPAAAGAAGPPPQATRAATATPPRITPDKPLVPENRVAQTRESMAVRERYPSAKPVTRGSGPGVNGGVGMNMPGVMSPEVLQHPVVQQLLQHYGISPESIQHTIDNASPNMFITNQGAYENHPVLSNILERGLEGAAFTKGSNTIGEGISNVAQGVLGANAARADKYNNQLMMPFAQAGQVAGLQGQQAEIELKKQQAAYDQAHSNYWDMLQDLRPQMEKDRQSNQDAQNLLKAQGQLNTYLNTHKDFALNADQQGQLDDLNKQYKGQLNVPFSEIQGVYNTAIQRYEDKKAKDQLQRVREGNYTKRDIAGMAADHTEKRLENQDAQKELDTLQKGLVALQKSSAATGDGYDVHGGYVRGAKLKAAVNEYQDRINQAVGALKAVPESMKVPGSAMVTPRASSTVRAKTKGNLTYDPATDTMK